MGTVTIPPTFLRVARAMRCVRKNLRRFPARSAARHWHIGLGLLALLAASVTAASPAAAQAAGGGEGSPPAATGGPAIPAGAAPDILPLVPGGGFGLPNPLTPPNAVNSAIPPAAVPGVSLALPPAQGSVTTLQAYDPNAPAILISPSLHAA